MSKTNSAEDILTLVQSGKLSIDDAQQQLKQLKLADMKKLTYKISPKGAISFYGLRRMPITLYNDELSAIVDLANSDEFKTYLVEHHDQLSSKEKNKDT
jgi:hypothetical protein